MCYLSAPGKPIQKKRLDSGGGVKQMFVVRIVRDN